MRVQNVVVSVESGGEIPLRVIGTHPVLMVPLRMKTQQLQLTGKRTYSVSYYVPPGTPDLAGGASGLTQAQILLIKMINVFFSFCRQ